MNSRDALASWSATLRDKTTLTARARTSDGGTTSRGIAGNACARPNFGDVTVGSTFIHTNRKQTCSMYTLACREESDPLPAHSETDP